MAPAREDLLTVGDMVCFIASVIFSSVLPQPTAVIILLLLASGGGC